MKLLFNIQDIPEGRSSKEVMLDEEDLDLEPFDFKGGQVQIRFNRTLYFIQASFTIKAGIELICDRSLEPFIYNVNKDFEVIFKVGIEEADIGEKSIIRPFNFNSQQIDLETDIRDTMMLDIPPKKIHPKYIDEEGNIAEFETRRYGKTENSDDAIDPRWEALKALKNNE